MPFREDPYYLYTLMKVPKDVFIPETMSAQALPSELEMDS